MAMTKISGLFGVKECQIAPITTDGSGAAVGYAAPMKVPGIKSLKFDLNVKTSENRGDEEILDVEDNIEYVDVSWENAEVSLDVLAAINGGTVTDSGTADAEKSAYMLAGSATGKYFKLFAKPKRGYKESGVADVLLEIFKVKGMISVGFVSEGYAACSFKGKGIRTKGTIDSTEKAIYRLSFGESTLVIA